MIASDTDKAYIAGLIDGEGSVRILHSAPKEQRGQTHGAVVKIRMTRIEPVLFVAERYGGKLRSKGKTIQGKTIYDLKIYSYGALNLLADISPYLKIKKQQVLLVRSLYKVDPGREGP